MCKIKIIVVDDLNIVRQGIIALFQNDENIQVIGEAANGNDAVASVLELKPDVTIMDYKLPDISGSDAIQSIRKTMPDARFVILSMYDDPQYVAASLRVGAQGYILKECIKEELSGAIEVVHDGGTYLDPKVSETLEGTPLNKLDNNFLLSPRELQVAQLLAIGLTRAKIAKELNLSPRTVDRHMSSSISKLGLRNTVQLINWATRSHLGGMI